MPNGMAVTRITPRYWKPPKMWPSAGSGTWKPKFSNDALTLVTLMPAMSKPRAVPPQAIVVPTAIATSPAGTPRK